MQGPILIFDHIKKQIVTVRPGQAVDKKLADALEAQRKQAASSGRPTQ